MNLRVIAVGKLKQDPLRAVVDEYYKRTGRFTSIDEVELKDGREADVVQRIRRAIPARSQTIALEVNGKAWGSHDLADFFVRSEGQGVAALAFLIGGAYGLPAELSAEADFKLSLSPMTLPHRLARAVLAEQIYRGFSIARGTPYDH